MQGEIRQNLRLFYVEVVPPKKVSGESGNASPGNQKKLKNKENCMFRKTGILTALAVLVLSVSLAQAAPIVLKLGHVVEPVAPYAQGATLFAQKVTEKTNGTVEVQVFPNSQLGNQRDMIEGMIFGTVDMCMSTTAVLGNFVPEMSVFDLPFIFRDRDHAYKALDSLGMELAKLGEKRGFKVLVMMENGVRHMTNSKRSIKKPEDMKALKFRVMEQPTYIKMMELLGASPTPMAFGEVYTALQKGVIDGQENPLSTITTSRLFEVQKYISLTGHTYSAEPMLIGMKAWNKLSADQQKAVQEAAAESLVWQRDLCKSVEAEYIAQLTKEGKNEINDDVDKVAFAAATKDTFKLYANKVKNGQQYIDRILAMQ